jgi:L-ascorbate metabolism protein UlaG (beta-lactamase superfamily)
MIKPLQQDDALLAEVAAVRAQAPERLNLWWLGQSGFLVAYAGELMVFDPYLSDALTHKYAATDKPHVRLTERVVDPSRLTGVSLVTSTHTHTDHLDAETLVPLLRASPGARLVLPAANEAFAKKRLGEAWAEALLPIAPGERRDVGPFSVETVPAAHEEVSPEFVGFLVRAGPYCLYHSGDTLRYPGMAELLRPRAIDVALLPINGRAPERRVAGNLDGPEAAQLAHDIGARWVVPCHYELFAFNTASPAPFVATCARLGQPCVVLRAGERWQV